MTKRYLWSGLFTLLPLLITFLILKLVSGWLISLYQSPLLELLDMFGYSNPSDLELFLFSIIGTFLILFIFGVLVSNTIGRQLLKWVEELILKIPIIKSIYSSISHLTSAIQNPNKASFNEVVMVEFPNAGSQTLGFIAHKDCSWISPQGTEWYSVFIPTSPNPSNGYVVMLPKEKIKSTSIAPDEAFTWVVSCGVIIPKGSR